jgi:hypothetical protein
MAGHAVEGLDPLVPLFNRRGVLADEGVDGRAHQRPNRARQTTKEVETFGRCGLEAQAVGLVGDERFQDIGERFVFAQQLMYRCRLGVPEQTKLTSLVDDRGIRRDFFLRRRAQVGRNLADKYGNVIEQLIRRKDVVRSDGQKFLETSEPLPGERESLRGDSLRNNCSVAVRSRGSNRF